MGECRQTINHNIYNILCFCFKRYPIPLLFSMKRIFVTILSILYMASAIGTTIHLHYCMGKPVSASLVHKKGDTCYKCCGKKSNNKGCCKDEQKTFKTGDHQFANLAFDFSHYQVATLLPSRFSFSETICTSGINLLAKAHAPPALWRTCPIYVQVRNFRI